MIKSKTYANQKKNKSMEGGFSFLNLTIITLTCIFIFLTPYQKALFNGNTFEFERPLYTTFFFASIALIILSVWMFNNYKISKFSIILLFCIWCIPLSFFISSFNSVSLHLATNSIYISLFYAFCFVIGITSFKKSKSFILISRTLWISSLLIILFGLLNYFGDASLFGLINWSTIPESISKIYKDSVMMTDIGLRLTSVFQYANTYACFLLAFLFLSLSNLVRSNSKTGAILYSIVLVPTLVSFFLTLSRGALVIVPIIFLLILPFFSFLRQILFLLYFCISTLASLLILKKISMIGENTFKEATSNFFWTGWFIVIAAGIISSLIIYVIQHFALKYEKRIDDKIKFKYKNFLLSIIIVLLGTIIGYFIVNKSSIVNIFPEEIKERIENINLDQHSVRERETFYKDAIKLIKDYPLLGAGGGAWSVIYEKYQNNPYTSRQAHNFFLQYIIEVGIIGFFCLLLFLLAIYYLIITSYFKRNIRFSDKSIGLLIFNTTILFHSAIDFDLSYVYLGAIVFLFFGVILSNVQEDNSENHSFSVLSSKYRLTSIISMTLAIIGIITTFSTFKMLQGSTLFNNSIALINRHAAYQDISKPLDQAISLQPKHPDYILFKSSLLIQLYTQTKNEQFYNQANDLINKIKATEPYNRQILEQEYDLLIKKGNLEKAYELINNALAIYPWDSSLYERAIVIKFTIGQNNKSLEKQEWDIALNIYTEFQNKIKELEKLPKTQGQGRPFYVTPDMAMAVGQIYYSRKEYSNSESVFRSAMREDELDVQINRSVIRWLLASLIKQGTNDTRLYEKLLEKDPSEKQKINELISTP
ncbi:O-antigen ligase family protein [Paenibacillus hamazuiensis]|uniref:O-antigen ligase family protein n=1 Tax=Paenibacillus hamazuiensis TaxID=2936508 RepID=UPI00200CFE81|nr:O-antigen ligase family protein [Paenibacillus hamazuiensis]